MQELIEKTRIFIQANPVALLLGIFFVLNLFSLPLFMTEERSSQEPVWVSGLTGNVPKLSKIRLPSIDEEAAAVIVPEETGLPVKVWVFLLLAYCGLIIFNLAYEFEKTISLRWGWELSYTILFLFGWFYWDTAAVAPWFPLFLVQMGVLIYALYLYFFSQRMKRPDTLF